MTHKITQIKQALASAIVAANTAVGNRVFINRQRNLSESELPAIVVEFDGATGQRDLDQKIRRRGQFSIRILVKDKELSAPDTQAEEILEQVEAAFVANLYVGAADEELQFGDIRPEGSVDSEGIARALTLSVAVTWMFDVYGPPTDAFETFVVDIDMANPRNDPQGVNAPDGQIDAAATVTLEQ